MAVKRISGRSATEEDLKKRQNWSVGTFHRASRPTPKDESSGEPKPSDDVSDLQNLPWDPAEEAVRHSRKYVKKTR